MAGGYYKLHFDNLGQPLSPDEQEQIISSLLDTAAPPTDLWIFSHGWNNNEERADATYSKWVDMMSERMSREAIDKTYTPLFVGVYWPSMVWIDTIKSKQAFTPPSPALSIPFPIDEGEFEIETDEVIKRNETRGDAEREAVLEMGKAASPDQPLTEIAAKEHFVEAWRTILDPAGEHINHYRQDFSQLYDICLADHPSFEQLETCIQLLYRYKVDDPHSDSNEENNILTSPEQMLAMLCTELSTANVYEHLDPETTLLQFLHTFTFWTMKARAAIVGQNGLAIFLHAVKMALQSHQLHVRLHLLGHSFGAKLVSASVYTLADLFDTMSPLVDDLILLLGAFSQFSFSSHIPLQSGGSGHYASIIERRLVAHPVTAIYSQHDLANRRSYPLGMFLNRSDSTYEWGSSHSRFGSIGANGAQGLENALYRSMNLLPLETPYQREDFSNVAFLNIDGQHVINYYADRFFIGAHGDIYRPEIFHLALALSRYD